MPCLRSICHRVQGWMVENLFLDRTRCERETTFFKTWSCVYNSAEVLQIVHKVKDVGIEAEHFSLMIHLYLLLIKQCFWSSFLFFLFQACAPRYVYHQQNPRKAERNEPVGTCFIAKDNFREYQEYSPCRTSEYCFSFIHTFCRSSPETFHKLKIWSKLIWFNDESVLPSVMWNSIQRRLFCR